MVPRMSLRNGPRRRWRIAATFLVFLVVTGPPSAAQEGAPSVAERQFTVMTYNLYLGADLGPLFVAPPGPDLVAAAAAVYAQMVGTDFPERAEVIAREVAEESPALVGLQEVALWQTGPLSDPTQLQPTYDFLATLLGELDERGARYEPVATNVNFGGALPISATTLASFTDHDVILARSDLPTSELKVSNPTSHTLPGQASPHHRRGGDPGASRMVERGRQVPGQVLPVRQHTPRGVQPSDPQPPGPGARGVDVRITSARGPGR